MIQEDKSAMNRAAKAKALLGDPELTEAFQTVRSSLLHKIEECDPRNTNELVTLKLQLKLLNDVRANLFSVVNTGKVIESRINLLEKARKGINAFRR